METQVVEMQQYFVDKQLRLAKKILSVFSAQRTTTMTIRASKPGVQLSTNLNKEALTKSSISKDRRTSNKKTPRTSSVISQRLITNKVDNDQTKRGLTTNSQH